VIVTAPVTFEGKAGVVRGKTFNLSLKGCAMESGGDLKGVDMNATIKLDLLIPTDKKPVKVTRAKVIWTAGHDVGVEFVNMDQTGQRRLREFLTKAQTDSLKQRKA
jgi:hypothetical protein